MTVVIAKAHFEQDITITIEPTRIVLVQCDRIIRMDYESARALAHVLIGMTDTLRRDST